MKILPNSEESNYKQLVELPDFQSTSSAAPSSELPKMLQQFLSVHNGFYALSGGLHVYSSDPISQYGSLEWWNQPDTWKGSYHIDLNSFIFFAEDVFGNQFGMNGRDIYSFNAETGELTKIADTITGWIRKLKENLNELTGYPIAHEWVEHNGPIPKGARLIPTVPFILGGDYTSDNLSVVDAVEAMRLRADIANQIKDSPDGTKVSINITD